MKHGKFGADQTIYAKVIAISCFMAKSFGHAHQQKPYDTLVFTRTDMCAKFGELMSVFLFLLSVSVMETRNKSLLLVFHVLRLETWLILFPDL